MTAPQPKPWIMGIAPYIPGRSTTDDGRKVAQLSSNENPLGTSPAARNAFANATGALERYPDASAAMVREWIAATYDLDPARVLSATGTDDMLPIADGAFGRKGGVLGQSVEIGVY